MGTDIHAYVEYAMFQSDEGTTYWGCLIENAGSRDYDLFGLLAGLRGREDKQLYLLKGLPEVLSSTTYDSAYLRVVPSGDEADEGTCTLEQVASWGKETLERGTLKYCEHPDWHNQSWLTYTELANVLAHYMLTWPARGPAGAE